MEILNVFEINLLNNRRIDLEITNVVNKFSKLAVETASELMSEFDKELKKDSNAKRNYAIKKIDPES